MTRFRIIASLAALTLVGACGSNGVSTASTVAYSTLATPAATVASTVATTMPPSATTTPTRTLSVTGVGSAVGVPDRVSLALAVQITNPSAAVAMRAANEDHAALIAWLTEQGIAPRDMQTVQLSLSPVYEVPSMATPPPITGYAASIGLTVDVRDVDTAGALVDGAIAVVRDLQAQGIWWTLDDSGPVLSQARAAAFAAARAQAEQLAALAGMRLGAVRSVTEGTRDPAYAYAQSGGGMGGGGYAPGTQTFQVAVTVEFELV